MSVPAPELHERLLHCARLARAVDVRPFELRPASEALHGLVPPVVQVLELGIGVCRDVLGVYDPVEASGPGDLEGTFGGEGRDSSVFHVDVDALLGRASEQRRVADVAFLGVTELRPKLGRIERLRVQQDPWEIVAECGSALRRVEKSLTAIEVVLCHAAQVPAQLSFASRLTRSLEVRQQYARLRHTITGTVVSEVTQQRALRLVGTAIAILIGKEIYPDLRIHDRRQLRALQERILAWLRQDVRGAEHAREGQRLWQDLVGFADLLALVSRRQELVEHDSSVIAHAHGRLLARERDWDTDALERLRTLRGLDVELDALLESGERATAAWAPIVQRFHRALCEPRATLGPGHGDDVLEERRR